jgi:hypothetical protein
MARATQAQIGGNGKSYAKENESSSKHRPTWTKKVFPVQVAVFEFPTESGPPNFSVKLTRTFRRTEESEYENSDYLGSQDLLRAAKLLEAADAFIQSRLEADHMARRGA